MRNGQALEQIAVDPDADAMIARSPGSRRRRNKSLFRMLCNKRRRNTKRPQKRGQAAIRISNIGHDC